MSGRRGIALLLVVMTMTVLITGVTIIARTRTTQAIANGQAADSVLMQSVFREAQIPIRYWLSEESASIVLDPAAPTPMVPVLDDTLAIDGRRVRIRITAWDQHGMWPTNAAQLGLRAPADRALPGALPIPGLDVPSTGRRVLPSPEHPGAIGGLVATHNPWPTRSGVTRARAGAVININTAPAPMIEAIYGAFSLGDPGPILEQRARGELAVVSLSAVDARQSEIRLTSVSRTWSFRIDVWSGTMLRSCWMVFSNRGGNWMAAQRFVIREE